MQQRIHQKVGKNLTRPTFSSDDMKETQPHISVPAEGEHFHLQAPGNFK